MKILVRRALLSATLAVFAGCQPAPGPASPPTAAAEPDSDGDKKEETAGPTAPTAAEAPEAIPSREEWIARAIAAPDRKEEDRALDGQRRPQELLAFFEIGPGMRVAELAAGGGYTAELLARVVGNEGRVYGQNSKFILEKFAEKPWSSRLALPVMSNVTRVDAEFEAPLPEEARELDALLLVLFYHDLVWFKADRAALNRAVFEALKPGGLYGIVDHSSKKGAGVSVAQSLHRIEESTLRAEVEAAGFVLEAEADFLRNEDDKRDWSASPGTAGERRGTSDRFVLRFRKPVVRAP